ncbi:hypothetical protein ACHHYP_14306 [Achlya hypogyna]|uniref:Secreted protein n=1 Tax=Achlya hypogyna TaxID=1202772 RepID=A0A0A7CNC1_ACHHY|nr:secreted protein [Achlya hypogyna]OQR83737.1 hypothetical protein ACHHYP_14306 [Achlya hypogyna]
MRVVIVVVVVTAAVAPATGTSSFPNPTPQGRSWAACSSAVAAITAQGDGSTPGSCMSCDPTFKKCPAKCQPLINTLYTDCDGVYTPPGLFFDPNATISGYWNGQINKTRIAVERCGCDAAHSIAPPWFLLTLLATIALLS